MYIIRSTTPDTKTYDNVAVSEVPDYAVVQSEDGKRFIAPRAELHDLPAARLIVRSGRTHIQPQNGKEVRVVRYISPNDNGYSPDVPQVAVAPLDGGSLFTVQTSELGNDHEEFDGTVRSKRFGLKDQDGKSVKVVRSVMPGEDPYVIGGPHHYWVKGSGKDDKEYVVRADEVVASKSAKTGEVPGTVYPGDTQHRGDGSTRINDGSRPVDGSGVRDPKTGEVNRAYDTTYRPNEPVPTQPRSPAEMQNEPVITQPRSNPGNPSGI